MNVRLARPTYSPRLRFVDDPNAGTGGGGTGGLTQEQVDQIVQGRVAAAERAARDAAAAELATKLGGKSLDDILAAAQAAQAAEDAAKTQAQKDAEAAAATKAEAEQLRATAKSELHTTRVHAALLAAGAPEAAVSALVVPGLTVDSTPEEIKTAVTALKTTLPGLFTATAAITADPGNPPKPTPPAGTFGAGGASEFDRRYPAKA